VGSLHVSPLVVVRPACDKRNEILLPTLEFAHIHALVEMTDALVLQHQLIKLIDYC
jgi:hypothetical protein